MYEFKAIIINLQLSLFKYDLLLLLEEH